MNGELPTIDEGSEEAGMSSHDRRVVQEYIERDMRKQELCEKADALQKRFQAEEDRTGGPGSETVRGGLTKKKTTEELEGEKEELSSLLRLLVKQREEEAQWRIDKKVDETDERLSKLPRSYVGPPGPRSPSTQSTASTVAAEEPEGEQTEEELNPKQETVRGERTYPTGSSPKRIPLSPTLQEITDRWRKGRPAVIEPALTFNRKPGLGLRKRKVRPSEVSCQKAPCATKKCKTNSSPEKPTSSEILADQFVVEKRHSDARSSLEILEDQYEKEEGQRILLEEQKKPPLTPEEEEERDRRQEEEDAKLQQENERLRREVLEELDEMSLPSVKPSSQDSCSVTMESVDEEETDEEVREQPKER
jgi:hypothetical protein